MPKIVLIHGNSTGITFATRPALTEDGGFKSFKEELKTKNASLYSWYQVTDKYNWFETLNPIVFKNQYFLEWNYCNSNDAKVALKNFLEAEQPECVIAHSMGCFLLSGTINLYGLPLSVNKVCLVQGAYNRNFKLTNPDIINRVFDKQLNLYNYHCFWDELLWLYVLGHFHFPAGLFGVKDKHIKNIFFPLNPIPSAHNDPLSSLRFFNHMK